MKKCANCNKREKDDLLLTCGNCSKVIHVGCLKSGGVPGRLLGDVFFSLICQECSPTGREQITREKMSWVNVIVLVLYNLSKRLEGASKLGYFHWKLHICSFIEKYWSVLYGSEVKKPKKSWVGTVSGTLSHYTDTHFKSGLMDLKESGWWRLVRPLTPHLLMKIGSKASQHGRANRDKSWLQQESGSSSQESPCNSPRGADESSLSCGDASSGAEWNNPGSETSSGRVSAIDLPAWGSLQTNSDMYSRAYVEPSETLSDCLFADEDDAASSDMDVDVEVLETLDIAPRNSTSFPALDFLLHPRPSQEVYMKKEPEDWVSAVPVGGKCNGPGNKEELAEKKQSDTDQPWVTSRRFNTRCIPMSEYEELQLLSQLSRVEQGEDTPGQVRRLYRKLVVRRLKREHNLPLFNLDQQLCPRQRQQKLGVLGHSDRILDRFQQHVSPWASDEGRVESCLFRLRLMGHGEPTCFYSPYTQRLLKPYIRRDWDCAPQWLCLMQEITARVHRGNPNWNPPIRAPIDYSYVRPQHIPSINSLCCEFFYPGVDVSECLQYPDFSCVVLYKKLVVGFALMVPDVGYNETYISFLLTRPEWRRAGIATFMLYHLIQTCMGKDVTLHVSATNPALILYQKFGFKVEEFVQDFYDKYLPAGTKECKHALFLRLSR